VERTNRVESFHVRPISPEDRARFLESWRGIQSRFVDGPAGAVSEADLLLGDVMSTRGYPVTDFDQRAADISVDRPLVLENYRTAHEIALRQMKGQANTEDLRQAMVHYRTLFDELVSEPKAMKAGVINSSLLENQITECNRENNVRVKNTGTLKNREMRDS
jgi:hypothetical protein